MKYSGKRSIILNNSSQDTQVKSIRKFSSDVKPAQNKTAVSESFNVYRRSCLNLIKGSRQKLKDVIILPWTNQKFQKLKRLIQ